MLTGTITSQSIANRLKLKETYSALVPFPDIGNLLAQICWDTWYECGYNLYLSFDYSLRVYTTYPPTRLLDSIISHFLILTDSKSKLVISPAMPPPTITISRRMLVIHKAQCQDTYSCFWQRWRRHESCSSTSYTQLLRTRVQICLQHLQLFAV